MAYLGGKAKSSEHILSVLNSDFFNGYDYIEPFCGYCHIVRRVENKKSYTISDNNELLIVLLKHIQDTKGEHPIITKDEYTQLRINPKLNKLKAAYAAFCYSYNGKYFGGFVNKYDGRNYPEERKSYYNMLHDNVSFHSAKIRRTDYTAYMDVTNKLIYCDPPYADTTEYHASFNSPAFWEDMRHLSKKNYVFISEYTSPKDFMCIVKKTKRMSLSGVGATRKNSERLFVHESRLEDPIIKQIIKENKYSCIKRERQTRKVHKKN
jgi:DNA adenine methylase